MHVAWKCSWQNTTGWFWLAAHIHSCIAHTLEIATFLSIKHLPFYHFNLLFLFIYCVKVKKNIKYKDIYCNFVTLQPILVSFFTRVFLSIPYKQVFGWRLFNEIAKSLWLCPYFKVNIIHNNTVWLMTSYTNMLSGWQKGCTLDLKCL